MSEFFSMILLSLWLLLHLFQVINCSSTPLVPALYVFGDSMVDSGNNDFLNTTAKVNYNPYGTDFPAGPTGRFTNGLTSVDFLAQFLGLHFVPPYLGLSMAQKGKIITGMNYASGSAGILQETGSGMGKNLHLEQQIEFFTETVNQFLPQNFKTKDELLQYLSKSIFVVNIGSNDYLNNYLLSTQYNSSHLYTPEQFASVLLKEFRQHLQELHNLGARKFVVFNLGPLGCLPAIIKLENIKIGCATRVNEMVSLYNKGFHSMIQEMRTSFKGSTFVQGNVNLLSSGLLQTMASNLNGFNFNQSVVDGSLPLPYSFQKTIETIGDSECDPIESGTRSRYNYGFLTPSPCCSILDNETNYCLKDVSTCMDRTTHFFWDGYHPTQSVYRLLAVGCFYGPIPCTPINVLQLALEQPGNASHKHHFVSSSI
ncbi:hypothetical protein NE237_008387 [Protea cynaroides]|uniref:Uncharacterized protein n=1 Tax=Protea cynaroides TaxID=273540 RepID=A0A9Q0QZM1_9MAGN|nr:hypothetical protein NE237_008387 [Protea cynaroides]